MLVGAIGAPVVLLLLAVLVGAWRGWSQERWRQDAAQRTRDRMAEERYRLVRAARRARERDIRLGQLEAIEPRDACERVRRLD